MNEYIYSCIQSVYFYTVVIFGEEIRGEPQGPSADVNMMGYANSDQTASGSHFRLRARSFIVAEPQGNRVVFVNLDACMASQLVTIKVLERLKARYFNTSLIHSNTC